MEGASIDVGSCREVETWSSQPIRTRHKNVSRVKIVKPL